MLLIIEDLFQVDIHTLRLKLVIYRLNLLGWQSRLALYIVAAARNLARKQDSRDVKV
jgi:phage shock protein PspC (stress-responsive transcriptional regulator)